ncbi:PspC domain-containing protein [Lysobacter solisilvae (ex Woo and Kim 2020)]|uniref:PspC domain-containing protein n=1 Tax=Agrilutibacter terrestris TaxID=2865112 RepID=A0A7H0FXX9_9GAMM|nr:PspC domain-containing protein [Lysobacter terrestris]QNP40895.1 PspC domain-containing protein [Lysobacter terrestris]
MNAPRTLSRSRHDRIIAGVMGGIARRFGWSATLTRVLYVVLSIVSAGFPGILVYLILWLLIPEEGN